MSSCPPGPTFSDRNFPDAFRSKRGTPGVAAAKEPVTASPAPVSGEIHGHPSTSDSVYDRAGRAHTTRHPAGTVAAWHGSTPR